MNKDLVLREKLAIQRTELANQSTFLAFVKTGLYFFLAAFSIRNILKLHGYSLYEILLYMVSGLIFSYGIWNYSYHKKKIKQARENIGKVKDDFLAR